jgi:uncharacterized protein (DUF952 family)
MSELIVHLCQKQDWEIANDTGEYRAESLHQEGFIHCSRPDQVIDVANKFYQGISDMILLWIEPGRVLSEIRWEAADAEVFPHIYGALNLDAVLAVRDIAPDKDGIYRKLPKS